MRFKPISSEIKVGDILAKYYTQKEWAIYRVTAMKKIKDRNIFIWEPLVISDMSNKGWKEQAKINPSIWFFDSKELRHGEITKISDNYSDPGIRGMCYKAVARVMEGKI